MILIGRIKKWLWHNQVFYSRGNKLKFWSKVLVKFTGIAIICFWIIGGILFVNIVGVPRSFASDHGSDKRSVYVSEGDLELLREKYDSDLEKGFCIYGSVSKYSIQVEEIVHDDNPMSQDSGSISFNCIDETVERLPELARNRSYQMIGNIHTHPEHSALSRPDAFTFGATSIVQDTFGVYNGIELDFFTPGSLSYELDMYVKE